MRGTYIHRLLYIFRNIVNDLHIAVNAQHVYWLDSCQLCSELPTHERQRCMPNAVLLQQLREQLYIVQARICVYVGLAERNESLTIYSIGALTELRSEAFFLADLISQLEQE